jgi:uncharacterized protein YjiS (DUF1127 family)
METNMSALALTRLSSVSAIADGVVAFVRDWAEASAKRAAFRRTRDELAVLSDRELDDLGVSRWEIEEVARASVYGR